MCTVKGLWDEKLLSILQCLWFIVGAILHLGQMEYEAGDKGYARVKDRSLLARISKVI